MRNNFRIRNDYWITNTGEAIKAFNPETHQYGHEPSALYYIIKENLDKLKTTDISINDHSRTIKYKLKQINTENLNLPQDIMAVLTFEISATQYMINKGWIRVNGNNIDTNEYNQNKQQQLAKGLKQIMQIEKIPEHANIQLDIWNEETRRSMSANTNLIFSQEISPRTNDITDTQQDNKFNYWQQQHPHKSKISKTKSQLIQQGLQTPGHELWRGTSESFSQWLENNS